MNEQKFTSTTHTYDTCNCICIQIHSQTAVTEKNSLITNGDLQFLGKDLHNSCHLCIVKIRSALPQTSGTD